MAKQQIHTTTQNFTEIQNITDDIVFFKDNTAASIIEISAVNFYLLSKEEQDARIYAYMSFLNSLAFQVQILIISKKIDLSSYLKLLDQKIASSQNSKIGKNLKEYKEFIKELTKGEELLDKKIYAVVPFSHLELGPISSTQTVAKGTAPDYIQRAKEKIFNKRNLIITQFQRMGLYARPVKTDELTKLFYEIYNQETITSDFEQNDIKNIIL